VSANGSEWAPTRSATSTAGKTQIPPDRRPEDPLAYVERERAGYFRWETYTDPHYTGSEPDRRRAQVKALDKLEEIGALP
jgi:hypothetical protein